MTDARLQILVGAPAADVWRALREPERWFGWQYEGLGDEIAQIFGDADVDDEQRTLDTGGGRFELLDGGPACVVRLVRDGHDGPFDAIDHGWLTFTQQLRFAVERHPEQARRTLHHVGTPRPGGMPLSELGLAGVMEVEPGDRYAATLATGEEVAGELWFRDEGQVGVTVDGWGDGLLVLFGGWEEWVPDGQLALVATAYGLDDAAFDALAACWTSWFTARHT